MYVYVCKMAGSSFILAADGTFVRNDDKDVTDPRYGVYMHESTVCMHACMYVYMLVCLCTYVFMYVYMYVKLAGVDTYISTPAYIYTYIHIHIHTYIGCGDKILVTVVCGSVTAPQ
jgi:hypothetical protein